MELADVERALDALETDGGRLFDAPSCDCVRALLTRAEALEGGAHRWLVQRAWDHLARLSARLERARDETRRRLAAATRAGGPKPRVEQLVARGELVKARRALRRMGRTQGVARATGEQLARRDRVSAYDDALAELVACLALARAVEVVPEGAGPYNPLRIASELLERMRAVSPLYLTAQLNRLEELASLLTLPELPARSARLPRRRSGSAKRSG